MKTHSLASSSAISADGVVETRRFRWISRTAALIASTLLAFPSTALADGFATPPGDDEVAVVRHDRFDPGPSSSGFQQEDSRSIVRVLVGPSAKFDAESAAPGLLVGADLGKGPAGVRLSAAWMNVGTDHGISQYTAELTLDFGGRSRIRPVLGAGGGYARTSSSMNDDGTLDSENGANLGIGVVRGGVGLRLPFEETDARVQLDLTGAFPAIRADNAPDVTPWAVTSLTVAIGF
jgi:hypothetical protein